MQQVEWAVALGPHLRGCQQLGRLKNSLSPVVGGNNFVNMNTFIFLLTDLYPAELEKGTGLGHLDHLY